MQHPLSTPVSRRRTLATLGAGTAGLAIAGPAAALQDAPKSDAQQLLDSIADNLLAQSPEGATSLGIDTGARAAMRGQLGDRSAAGVQLPAAELQRALAKVPAARPEARTAATPLREVAAPVAPVAATVATVAAAAALQAAAAAVRAAARPADFRVSSTQSA